VVVRVARLSFPALSFVVGSGVALSAAGCGWMHNGTEESAEKVSRLLEDLYALPEGRHLDIRPPPHPPKRLVLYRTWSPSQARAIPSGPTATIIVWRDDGPVVDRVCFGCDDLVSLLAHLGVRRDAIRVEGGLEDMQVIADVVKRDGATRDELLSELPGLLSERLDLDVSLQQVETMSRTLVLRGEIGTVAPDDEYGGARYLHAFADTKNEDPRRGAGGGPSTDAGTLVELLSIALDAGRRRDVRASRRAFSCESPRLGIRHGGTGFVGAEPESPDRSRPFDRGPFRPTRGGVAGGLTRRNRATLLRPRLGGEG